MATVNRYTRIEPARYNPRTLEELMLAPQYKRGQHDAVEEGFAGIEAGIAQADPLEIHSSDAKMEQDRLYNQITEQAETLNKEGFSNSAKSRFLKINKDYQTSISPMGKLGKINAAKTVFLANQKAHIDGAVKAGFSQEQALANWQKHAQRYAQEFEQTGAVTPIGGLGNPLYVDALETSKDLFKDAGFTESDIGGGLMSQIIPMDDGGQYVLNSAHQRVDKSNIEQLSAAVQWLNSNINNPNSDIAKSMAYEGKTPQMLMQEIGNLAEVYVDTKTGDKQTRTITGFKSAKDMGVPSAEDVNYQATEAKGMRVKRVALNNSLTSILSGKKITVVGTGEGIEFDNTVPAINSTDDAFARLGKSIEEGVKTEDASITNTMTPSQKTDYYNTYEALKTAYPELEGLHPDSHEAIGIISNHLDSLENEVYQDFIVTDDVVTNYGNRSIGIKPATKGAVLNDILGTAQQRTYGYDNKIVSFDQLPPEVKLALAKKEGYSVEYSGYYAPKNFLKGEYTSATGADYNDMFVSPNSVTIIDPKGGRTELLVSRSTGEMAQPSYQADKLFTNIYQTTKKLPEGTFSFPNADGTGGVKVMYARPVFKTMQDPNTKQPIRKEVLPGRFIINSATDPGKPLVKTEEGLQDLIYQWKGVTEKSKKKK